MEPTPHNHWTTVNTIARTTPFINITCAHSTLPHGITMCLWLIIIVFYLNFYCTFVIQCGCHWSQLKAIYLLTCDVCVIDSHCWVVSHSVSCLKMNNLISSVFYHAVTVCSHLTDISGMIIHHLMVVCWISLYLSQHLSHTVTRCQSSTDISAKVVNSSLSVVVCTCAVNYCWHCDLLTARQLNIQCYVLNTVCT